jgi:molybdate transport system substrate-binding protein
MRTIARCACLCAAAILLIASGAVAGEIDISAAASLKEVVNDLAARFAGRIPGVIIRTNFGASGVLARQIEQGAPADIFISANREWMDYLQNRNLVDHASRCDFAYNTLVFAGTANPSVTGMKDLRTLRMIAIGSPQSVPAGEYAMESLKASGVERDLAGKIIMAKDVREAMKYAELGEVDGAFVYRTDALLLGKRTRILFPVPEELHQRVTYPMALTVAGTRKKDAQEFLRFLRSAETRTVLERYGFTVK